MRLKTTVLVAAALTTAALPIAASASDRSAAPIDRASELAEGGLTQLIVLAVIAAVIIGGIAIADDDSPSSP